MAKQTPTSEQIYSTLKDAADCAKDAANYIEALEGALSRAARRFDLAADIPHKDLPRVYGDPSPAHPEKEILAREQILRWADEARNVVRRP